MTKIITALLLTFSFAAELSAANYYLDLNGAANGSGVTNGGVYSVTNAIWSSSSAGTVGTVKFPGRNAPVFSAGADADSLSYTVTGNLGQTSGGIAVNDGFVTFNCDGSFFGNGTVSTAPFTSLVFAPASWDFYGQTMTFNAAAGTYISVNSISTASGRTGGIIKTGAGLVTVLGAATARGITINVNDGELRIANNNALYTAVYSAVTTVNSGSLELSNNITVANNPLILNGAGFNNLGALRNVSGTNFYNSPITLASHSRIAADTNTVLNLNPTGTNAVNGAFNLTLGGDGQIVVGQPMTNLTTLIKDGAGTVTFTTNQLYAAPTIVSNGTLRLVNANLSGGVTNNASLVFSNSSAQTFSFPIAGNGQIFKQGGSRLTLAATNNFTGSFFVNSGTLALAANGSMANASLISVTNGALLDVSAVTGFTLNAGQTLSGNGVITGAVTMATGAMLSPGFAGLPGVLTFSNSLTLGSGATNYFDLSPSTNGANDQIYVAGNYTLAGPAVIRISYTALTNGSYRLIRTGGSIIGNVAQLQLVGFFAGAQTASLVTNATGNAIDLVIAPNARPPVNLTWTGDGAGNVWDVTNSLCWHSSGVPAAFYSGDAVKFDDSGASNLVVNLLDALAPVALTVNAVASYTMNGSGSIIGPVSLVKTNSGTLVINTTNVFTGGVFISGGAVQINNSSALGTGGITNNSALVFNSSAMTFTNFITGNGSLTNLTGSLLLGGSNNFSGNFTVAGGLLQIAAPFALGNGAGTTIVNVGAVLDLNGQSISVEPFTLAGGTLTNSSLAAASLGGALTLAAASSVGGNGDIFLNGGVNGNFPLTKTTPNNLVLSGAGNFTGLTTVASGLLTVNGTSCAGGVVVNSGATLGGDGVILGAVTNLSGSTIEFGANFASLTISNALVLNSGGNVILKVGRNNGAATNDSLAGITTLKCGGTLTVVLAGNAVQDGDTFQLFSTANATGAFDSISLPWLYTGLVWDTSALANGTLRVVALPDLSTFAQRRAWTINQAAENPGAVNDDFVQAEVYFSRGQIALGQSTALAASRALTNNVQVDFFNMWPAMDCYIRFNQYLDAETKANIKTNVTTCTQYAGTSTANLYTLGHVIRYLGSEQFGEAAFATNAIWRANDPNAYFDTLALLGRNATNGYGETASRPYYEKNLLPILTLAQLATNPLVANRAMLAFQAGLSQNAGCWMRGHLGLNTGRSYPDMETQTPMGSMRTLWVFLGGDAPPTSYTYAALAAVMNYEPPPVIQMAATNRTLPFISRGGYYGAQQNSFVDRDYVLFSQGPEYYGNFQVYPSGLMWCDPDDNHFSQFWLCAPWNDDPAIVSGSWPHGMNRAIYSEAQCRDSVVQIYNFTAGQTNPPPYVLGYVPGGWQAMVNDAMSSGKIFLHYGTVMLAISSEVLFKWDTNSDIYAVSQSPTRPGDSEFRIWGQPIPDFMQSVTNLANTYLGTWNPQFAMALETARPDLYPGAKPAAQLAAFRADIYAHTGIRHSGGDTPTGYYTNRHGDTLQVSETTTLTPSPIVINGQTPDLPNWPLTDNPWIFQRVGGNLTLWDGAQSIVYDFNTWTITTNSTVLQPTCLLASANSNRVFLTWNGRWGVTNYFIKRASVSGGPYTSVGSSTNLFFYDNTAVGGTTYYYVVTAANSAGESTNSNEAAVITLPNPPTGLNATLSGRTVSVRWNISPGATSYNLKRGRDVNGPFTTIAAGLASTNFTDQQFTGGGTFWYVVSAVNAAGEGPDSATASVLVSANYFLQWSNRAAISFPNYTAPEILSNFPALVVLSTNIPNFSYRQFASPVGRDLRFSDGALNELNYEVEQWNTNASSFVWVQIPALTSNTVIYAWWGNPAATNVPAYVTNGATWDGNFVGVWHLNSTPPAAMPDSTASGFSAVPNANLNASSQQAGISAGSIAFNGANTAMNLPNTNALGLTGGLFTLSAWVNLNRATNGVIIGKGQNGSIWYSWFLSAGNNPGVDNGNTANRLCTGVRTGNSAGVILASQSSDVTLSNWVLVAGVLDGTNLNLYVNGQLNAVTPTTANPFSNVSQLWIGADSGRNYFSGKLDELRVENVPRSPSWLFAQHRNIASNSVFNAYAPAVALNTNLPPKFSWFGLQNGQPAFTVSGLAGATFIVQGSTNLVEWANLFTNTPGAMPFAWSDVSAGNFGQHFYRVLLDN